MLLEAHRRLLERRYGGTSKPSALAALQRSIPIFQRRHFRWLVSQTLYKNTRKILRAMKWRRYRGSARSWSLHRDAAP
jgi:cystathionine beta-lyase/cystathionine gamma-synthase